MCGSTGGATGLARVSAVSEHQPTPPAYDALDDLLDVLDLQPEGQAQFSVAIADATEPPSEGDGDGPTALGDTAGDVFVGRSQPQPHGRVFGGQVLAQSVIAAGRTVDSDGPTRRIHSLHGYFLRAGDSSLPIRFVVERMRDGASFSARRVHAVQSGRILLSMITSFQTDAGGLDHQDSRPDVTPPDDLEDDIARVSAIAPGVVDRFRERRAIQMRHVQEPIFLQPDAHSSERAQSVWMRAAGTLPDDQLLHAAVLAYSSDYSLLEPVLRHHGLAWSDPRLRVASLDHAMWFHRPVRADEWILYTQDSPSAQGGRGLGTGRMFTADGVLAATVAQEGMVRVKED